MKTNTIIPHAELETDCPQTPGSARDFCMDKSEIARLSHAEIRQMDREALIQVIRSAQVPLFCEHVIDHLRFSDRADLEKVAFLARRTVQNQGY